MTRADDQNSIRLSVEVISRLKAQADSRNLSLSDYLEQIADSNGVQAIHTNMESAIRYAMTTYEKTLQRLAE